MGNWLKHLVISVRVFIFPGIMPRAAPLAPPPPHRPVVVAPVRSDTTTIAQAIDAKGVAVYDVRSGTVLYDQAGTAAYPLASITKLMTALVTLDTKPDWQTLITIQEADQRLGGRVVLHTGERVAAKDLFRLMLVASSNEAAVALARSSGLTYPAFVAAMNAKANALGLSTLHFVDVAGLEAGNVGSAADIAKLASIALGNSVILEAVKLSSYTVAIRNTSEQRTVEATNLLLRGTTDTDPRVLGGKTGFLDEVGYNYVAVFEHSGNRVSLAVLGAPSDELRWKESTRLAQWVFSHFRWPALGG